MENLIHVFNVFDDQFEFTTNDLKEAFTNLTGDNLTKAQLYNFIARLKLGNFISWKDIPIYSKGNPRVLFEKLKNIPEQDYWIFKGATNVVIHKISQLQKNSENYKIEGKFYMTSEQYENLKNKFLVLKQQIIDLKKTNCELIDECQELKTENTVLRKRLENGGAKEADMSFLDEPA